MGKIVEESLEALATDVDYVLDLLENSDSHRERR